MSQINIRNLSNENEDGAPNIVGVSTFSATSYFVPPKGTTAERPENPQPGDLRFNTDFAGLEYFKGEGIGWESIEMTSPDLNGGVRGLTAGGKGPTPSDTVTDTIQYTTLSTLGNSIDFGNLDTAVASSPGACASRTRGIINGGYTGSATKNEIRYVTFASTGDSTDFGDMIDTHSSIADLSSQIRGIWTFGSTPVANTLEYITIASTGNSVDFGDSTEGRKNIGACASSTRGLFAGGRDSSNNLEVNIDYLTIATTGNSSDFGDLTNVKSGNAGCSNATRGMFAGGWNPSYHNVIEYVTIATTGNASDFGDLTQIRNYPSACASPTRGIWAGGNSPADASYDIIDYVEIATTGNAVDFGNLIGAITGSASCSNGHGGL